MVWRNRPIPSDSCIALIPQAVFLLQDVLVDIDNRDGFKEELVDTVPFPEEYGGEDVND